MKKRLAGFLTYFLFWFVFFEFARIYFLVIQHKEASAYSMPTILMTFQHGLKLDISMASYLMLLPLLVFIPSLFFPGKWYRYFLETYSFILIMVIAGIVISDARIYSFWGYRLEYSSMAYIRNPVDAAASLRKGEILLYLVPFLLVSGGFIILCSKLTRKFFSDQGRIKIPAVMALGTALTVAALVIPIRGGFGTVPLNTSSAYFSDSLFPNHAALNVVWNIGHTSIYRKPLKNPYSFKDTAKAMDDLSFLTADNGKPVSVLKITGLVIF